MGSSPTTGTNSNRLSGKELDGGESGTETKTDNSLATPALFGVTPLYLPTTRQLRIDSKVNLNKGLGSLAERLANGETLPPVGIVALAARG